MNPRILTTTIAALLSAATLHAQTWDGGGVAGGVLDWLTAANWNPNVAPLNDGTANILFGGTIDNNPGPNLDQNWNVNSVQFINTAGAFVLGSTGNFTLTVQGGGIANSDTQLQTIGHSLSLGAAQVWNAVSGDLSIAGASVNNGGNLLSITGTSNTTISSVMSGAGGLTKFGTGTLTLSGATGNTFSGPTQVTGGVLILQKTAGVNALNGSVTVGDGVGTDELRLGANNQIPTASLVTIANGGLFNLNGFSEGFLQLAVDAGGSTTIGAGTLTLSTNLTMTGGSVSSSTGSLVLQGLLNTNAAATSATISGNLDLAALSRTFTIADGAAAIDLDVSAIVSNGSIAKAGAGTLRLSGPNTFAGTFDLNAGSVLVGNNAAFGTSLLRLNGGTIQADVTNRTLSNNIELGGNLTIAGTMLFDLAGPMLITGNRTVTVSDPAGGHFIHSTMSESAAGFTFTKDGPGTLSFFSTTASAFTGLTIVKAGTLQLGGTAPIAGDIQVGDDVGGAGADILQLVGSNQIPNTANVEVRSSGTFALGGLSDTIGSLTLKGGSVTGGSVLTMNGNITGLADAQSATISVNVNLGGATRTFTIADGAAANDLDVTSVIGVGGIVKDGAGTLRLAGANSFAGGAALTDGTLAVGSNTALGTGTVTLTGGTLSTDGAVRTLTNAISLNGTVALTGAGGFLFSGPVTLTGASALVVTNASNSISGVLGGGATFSKQGIGPLFLTGSSSNIFTNTFLVEEGLLALNKSSGNAVTGFLSLIQNFAGTPEVRHFASNQIADSVGVSVSNGFLNLNGFSDTIGALTLTGGSVATGAGTLTLGGNLTTGVVAATGTIAGNLSLGGATRTFTVVNNAPAIDVDISAAISNGGIIKDGAGTLRLSGTVTNSFLGTTTVNAGTLVLAKPAGSNAIVGDLIIGDGSGGANADVVSLAVNEQIFVLSAVTINSSGLLDLAGFSESIGSLTMNGGSVTTGAGVLSFEAVPAILFSTASATTATISGNVTLSNVARIFTVADGAAVIDLDISAAIITGGIATGFTKEGAGLLRLSGTNTFAGGLTLNAGTLSIGAANALNTSTLFINSGTVGADGAARTIASLEVLGSGFVDGVQNLTVGGFLFLDPGSALTKNGTGTFTLQNAAPVFAGSLTLNTGTFAAGAQTLQAGGLFTQNGGTFTGTLTNQGTFTFNGGTFTGLLVNQGSVNFNANFTAANGITNTATITVGSGITVAANGPGLSNDGTLSLTNGTLAGSGPLVSNNFLSGFGTIGGTGGFTNNGLVSVSGGNLVIANAGANVNAGNIDVPIVRQLRLDTALTNTGTITLASTTLNGAATLTNSAGGIVTGRGTISAPLANSGGTLRADLGTLTVTNAFNNSGIVRAESGASVIASAITNQAGGQIILTGTLSTSGALTNAANGRITLRDGTGLLNGAGALSNGGLISGEGAVAKSLTNTATGEVRAESGKTLFVGGAFAPNAGAITLQGGTLDFATAITNGATGFISGRGTLRTNGITNQGAMAFSGGTADVFGDVTNSAGARIVTSGAGATTTFYDDVIHNGLEIFTGASASTVFFGAQSGAGSFTGTGTVYFIGDLRPGNSPASVLYEGDLVFGGASSLTLEIGGRNLGAQYDHLNVGGALHADGDLVLALLGGFTPQVGDTFDLFDVGTFAGDFDTISAPALAGGNAWDFSALKTTGSVTVVPEPGIGALLLSALGLLGWRGRLRGARSSRVLVSASRRNELPEPHARPERWRRRPAFADFFHASRFGCVPYCARSRKFVSAGRRNQRSGRACYPEFAATPFPANAPLNTQHSTHNSHENSQHPHRHLRPPPHRQHFCSQFHLGRWRAARAGVEPR